MTSRAIIVIRDGTDRALARRWVDHAQPGSRISFKGPQRTIEQNDRLWAMLTDTARQATLGGRRWTTNEWKVIFLHALGQEMRYLPPLDGKGGFIPYGHSSSDLSVSEMSALIDFIFAWGAENGILWSDPALKGEREHA